MPAAHRPQGHRTDVRPYGHVTKGFTKLINHSRMHWTAFWNLIATKRLRKRRTVYLSQNGLLPPGWMAHTPHARKAELWNAKHFHQKQTELQEWCNIYNNSSRKMLSTPLTTASLTNMIELMGYLESMVRLPQYLWPPRTSYFGDQADLGLRTEQTRSKFWWASKMMRIRHAFRQFKTRLSEHGLTFAYAPGFMSRFGHHGLPRRDWMASSSSRLWSTLLSTLPSQTGEVELSI